MYRRKMLALTPNILLERPISPAYGDLCEAVLETRNILRSLVAALEHSTIPKSQIRFPPAI
jgi:hypothetical protein